MGLFFQLFLLFIFCFTSPNILKAEDQKSSCPINQNQAYIINNQVKEFYDQTYPGDLGIVGKNWGCYRALRDDYIANKKKALEQLISDWNENPEACQKTLNFLSSARFRVRQIQMVNEGKCIKGCTNLYCKIDLKAIENEKDCVDCANKANPPLQAVDVEEIPSTPPSEKNEVVQGAGTDVKVSDNRNSESNGAEVKKAVPTPAFRLNKVQLKQKRDEVVSGVVKDLKQGKTTIHQLGTMQDLLVSGELHLSPTNEFPKDLDPEVFKTISKAHKKFEKAFVKSKGQGLKAQIQSYILEVNKQFTHLFEDVDLPSNPRYGKRMLDFYDGHGGNCQANTPMILSPLLKILAENKISLPEHWIIGVQVYADHIRPVIYDKNENKTWDLSRNVEVVGADANIYHPAMLLNASAMMLEGKSESFENFLLVKGSRTEDETDKKILQEKLLAFKSKFGILDKKVEFLLSGGLPNDAKISFSRDSVEDPRFSTIEINETTTLETNGNGSSSKKDELQEMIEAAKGDQRSFVDSQEEGKDQEKRISYELAILDDQQITSVKFDPDKNILDIKLNGRWKEKWEDAKGDLAKLDILVQAMIEEKKELTKKFSKITEMHSPQEWADPSKLKLIQNHLAKTNESGYSDSFDAVKSALQDDSLKKIVQEKERELYEEENKIKTRNWESFEKSFSDNPKIFISTASENVQNLKIWGDIVTEDVAKILREEFSLRKIGHTISDKTMLGTEWNNSARKKSKKKNEKKIPAIIDKSGKIPGTSNKDKKDKTLTKQDKIKIDRDKKTLSKVTTPIEISPYLAIAMSFEYSEINMRSTVQPGLINRITPQAKQMLMKWESFPRSKIPKDVLEFANMASVLMIMTSKLYSKDEREALIFLKEWGQKISSK